MSRKRSKSKDPASGASRQARRLATLVLEVLAGVRTGADAAQELGITSARYYVLESRALEGLVRGCEPVGRGPTASPDGQIRSLQRRIGELERELNRSRALARNAQRSLGLSAPKSKKARTSKRQRGPSARALRMARRLKSSVPEDEGATETTTS